MENREVKQFLSVRRYHWEEVVYKEKVKETECSRNIMYPHVKMEN
jgi:hypothetical protein